MPIVDAYTLVGAWPQAEVDLTPEALLEGMRARGVTRSLVTHTTAIFYSPRIGNELAAQVCAQDASLVPVAVLNPLDYPACRAEADRCLDAGIRVFRFCPREHRYPFSGDVGPLRELLRALERAKLLLVDLIDQRAPVLEADVEDLLPVPAAVTIDGTGLGTVIAAARGGPNLWVETSRLTAGGAIEAAVQHIGAARVVFGSGAPLRVLGSAVMSLQYADLSDADRAAVFEGNVTRALT